VARLGSWDPEAVSTEWFDISATSAGWVDRDVVPFPSAPPPPPVPPTPPTPIPFGGGGFTYSWYREPDPCVVVPVPPFPEEEPIDKPEESAVVCPIEDPQADYAVMPVGEEATVKALEAGMVEHASTLQGEKIILLKADSGTAYLYANIGEYVGNPRHVAAGETIGVTRGPGQVPVPEPETARALLGVGPEVPVAFTEVPDYGQLPEYVPAPKFPEPMQLPDLSYLLEDLPPLPVPVRWPTALKWILGGAAAATVAAVVIVVVVKTRDPRRLPRR
jgi:hypothetical protein